MTNFSYPFITEAIRGEAVSEFSFLDRPPREWTLALAQLLMHSVLDPATRKSWGKYAAQNQNSVVEISKLHAQAWVRRSQELCKEYPHIMAHATAIFEKMSLASEEAFVRLFGASGTKIAHTLAKGLHEAGRSLYPSWDDDYYQMRQTLETNIEYQQQVEQHIKKYPRFWNAQAEQNFQMKQAESSAWPLPLMTSLMYDTINWFNAADLSQQQLKMKTQVVDTYAAPIDSVKEVEVSSVSMLWNGFVQVEGPLSNHDVSYEMSATFSLDPVAGRRPLHIHIVIPNSLTLSDNASLNTTHSLATGEHLMKQLNAWLDQPIVKKNHKDFPFEASFEVSCDIKSPEQNVAWVDSISQTFQQALSARFNIPEHLNMASFND